MENTAESTLAQGQASFKRTDSFCLLSLRIPSCRVHSPSCSVEEKVGAPGCQACEQRRRLYGQPSEASLWIQTPAVLLHPPEIPHPWQEPPRCPASPPEPRLMVVDGDSKASRSGVLCYTATDSLLTSRNQSPDVVSSEEENQAQDTDPLHASSRAAGRRGWPMA